MQGLFLCRFRLFRVPSDVFINPEDVSSVYNGNVTDESAFDCEHIIVRMKNGDTHELDAKKLDVLHSLAFPEKPSSLGTTPSNAEYTNRPQNDW